MRRYAEANPSLVFGGFKSASCGATEQCAAGSYAGYMDNVRIWNKPLDSLAVTRHMNATLTPSHPYFASLVANYSFCPDASVGAVQFVRARLLPTSSSGVRFQIFKRSEL